MSKHAKSVTFVKNNLSIARDAIEEAINEYNFLRRDTETMVESIDEQHEIYQLMVEFKKEMMDL